MLDFLNHPKEDAIAIIKRDHDKVKGLFERFEETKNLREKKKIAEEAIMELKIHAEIEEKIFYPTVRPKLKADLMNEADEEHHVARLLIAELDQMSGREEHWEAKFTVLAENIRHHIREEEGEMLPKARRLNIDFNALGGKLMMMKRRLKQDGIPASEEEKLMKRSQAKADTPARNAKKKPASRSKANPAKTTKASTAGPRRVIKRKGKTAAPVKAKGIKKTASRTARQGRAVRAAKSRKV